MSRWRRRISVCSEPHLPFMHFLRLPLLPLDLQLCKQLHGLLVNGLFELESESTHNSLLHECHHKQTFVSSSSCCYHFRVVLLHILGFPVFLQLFLLLLHLFDDRSVTTGRSVRLQSDPVGSSQIHPDQLTICSTYSFPASITSKALFFCSGSSSSL